MRILIDHIASKPNFLTGITAYTWSIAAALCRMPGHQVFLHTNWDLPHIPQDVRSGMADIITCSCPSNETLSALLRSKMLPLLEEKLDIDVVLHPMPTGSISGKAAQVVVVHDLYRVTHPELHNPAQRLQWRLLFPRSLRAADALICVSHATRDALLKHYPEAAGKTFTVHEAAPLAPVKPLTKRCAAGDYALSVTNVRPTKNVSTLFDAIGNLSAAGFDGNFVLAGADPFGQVSKFLARHKEAPLKWLENPSDDELKNLYRRAFCYVNSSLTEGFCLPVLEAQSFGVPVVCSDLPVLREVAGEGALFFDPQDKEALAGHIASLFADSDLAAALSRAALSNSARFSWHRAATETVSVFEHALNGKWSDNDDGAIAVRAAVS